MKLAIQIIIFIPDPLSGVVVIIVKPLDSSVFVTNHNCHLGKKKYGQKSFYLFNYRNPSSIHTLFPSDYLLVRQLNRVK